ncbi:MAG: hypothetical protein OXF74_08870 [Rhodobacteraceae bacterium]|nr:hypothetical protein [Paracoccaceae bacterium]
MADEPPLRSRAARDAAEKALMRVVHHYGGRPEFVLLGGLVPELLCTGSKFHHAGTIDVDVQVGLEIACGAVNAERLEQALRNAGFAPEDTKIWRWVADGTVGTPIVKFELLADLQDQPADATIAFDACDQLGTLNLRGTGFAAHDFEVCEISTWDGDAAITAEVNVSGLAGFLLAKIAAAYSRRKSKDRYDIAFVLLHNDSGGTAAAVASAKERFGGGIAALLTALNDLQANFQDADAQGSRAYVTQMRMDHPELNPEMLAADAVIAVEEFCQGLRHVSDGYVSD